MPKIVYCANCGTRLNIMPKAVKGNVVTLVEYHECPDEPVELDLTPVDIPTFEEIEDKNKFVEKLNNLSPRSVLGSMSTGELRDMRDEESDETGFKSTAPENLLDQLKVSQPTIPEGDIGEEPDDG